MNNGFWWLLMHAEHVSHRRRCHVGPRDLTSQLASGQTGGEYTALLECGYQIFKLWL